MGKLDELKSSVGGNAGASLGAGRTPQRLRSVTPPPPADPKLRGVTRAQDAALIEVDRIVRDENQPREDFDPESLERLAQSLKTRGQLQPIRVRWDEGRGVYVIVCGERRWRAARMAGMETLACVVHEGPVDVLALQLIENALREDLKPIEQARAFKALIDANGWQDQQLAAELSVTKATVSRCLALLSLPEAVQEQVEQGALAPSAAYEVTKLPDPELQAEVARDAVDRGLTKTQVIEVVKAKRRPAQAKPEPASVDLSDCTVTVKWKRGGEGTLEDALSRALELVRSGRAA
jgi:ParB family chromosome partitioning protein